MTSYSFDGLKNINFAMLNYLFNAGVCCTINSSSTSPITKKIAKIINIIKTVNSQVRTIFIHFWMCVYGWMNFGWASITDSLNGAVVNPWKNLGPGTGWVPGTHEKNQIWTIAFLWDCNCDRRTAGMQKGLYRTHQNQAIDVFWT
jgi:hypothetical protein